MHNRIRYDQLDCHSAGVLQLNPNRTESVKKFTSKVVKLRRQRHQSECTLHFTLIRLHRLSVADSAQCETRHERDENLSLLFICSSVFCSPTADIAVAHKRERRSAHVVRDSRERKIGIIYTEKCKWNCNRLSAGIASNISTCIRSQ